MSRKIYRAYVEYSEFEDGGLVAIENEIFRASTPTELQGKINAMLIKLKPSTEEEILAMMDKTIETSVEYYTQSKEENL